MYSDTCGGKNRNTHFASMCLTALQQSKSLVEINHKFLLSGHSHMECDTDHSIIEKMKKKYELPIEHPRDWAQLIKVAAKKKPFVVEEMIQENFVSFSELLKGPLQCRKTDTENLKVDWRQIKWIKYLKIMGSLFLIDYSVDNEESFRTLSFSRRGKQCVLAPKAISSEPIPISREKKNDLIQQLPFIFDVFKQYYMDIKVTDNIKRSRKQADLPSECESDDF